MNDDAYYLASELEAQHRDFFRFTGWLVIGVGVLAVVVGANFLSASRRPTHRAREALLPRTL
jgi:hypothetical protein